MQALAWLRRARRGTARSVGVFVADVGRGLLEVSHNTLALVGLAAVAVLVFALGRAETRQELEAVALQWLQGRHEERELGQGNFLAFVAEPAAGARATAANPQQLPRAQAALATWIARRYKVAPEPVAALVQEAWSIGQRAGLDPTLILAIMAVESSFNPFAQSTMGAQGLMQVMTRCTTTSTRPSAAPAPPLIPSRTCASVQVLKECIERAGSLQEGLRFYVGAALLRQRWRLRRQGAGRADPHAQGCRRPVGAAHGLQHAAGRTQRRVIRGA
jgi:hypothetical protein